MRLGTRQRSKEKDRRKMVYHELRWIFVILFVSFSLFFLTSFHFYFLSFYFLCCYEAESYLYLLYYRPACNSLFNWDDFQLTLQFTSTQCKLILQAQANALGYPSSIYRKEAEVSHEWKSSINIVNSVDVFKYAVW